MKPVLHFCHHPLAWQYHSPSVYVKSLSKSAVKAHCPWRTSQSCYYQLHGISSVKEYLSIEATVELVTSLILSHCDYCSSLLSVLPDSSVHSLCHNCAACLILKKHKTDIIPLFKSLHWLPIQWTIQYKINTLCCNCFMGAALSYLCDCLQLYTSSHTLRSASDNLGLQIPCTGLYSAVGSCAFLFLVHLCEMTFSFLSKRNHLCTHARQTSTRFFSQNYRPATFYIPCCCLCLLPVLSCV